MSRAVSAEKYADKQMTRYDLLIMRLFHAVRLKNAYRRCICIAFILVATPLQVKLCNSWMRSMSKCGEIYTMLFLGF
jgi:hypothetical protein